jgi:hypothetical protein
MNSAFASPEILANDFQKLRHFPAAERELRSCRHSVANTGQHCCVRVPSVNKLI